MKTLIDSDKMSRFLWEDSVVITQDSSTTTVGDPVEYIVSDVNSSNSTIIENVPDVPSDWFGCKYIYDNGWKITTQQMTGKLINGFNQLQLQKT